MKHKCIRIQSPIGCLRIESNGAAITAIYMEDTDAPPPTIVDCPVLQRAVTQLDAYFDGSLKEFDLPLDAQGTGFQHQVWTELTKIPYGTTVSYGEIAARIGDKNAARAVGLANGRNPISIVVPCHRVIGANGKLVGYGGGMPRKQWLLQHERGMRELFR